MANPANSDPTPENVARLATTAQALEIHKLSLIGLVGPRDDMAALVRSGMGRIRKVVPGARLAGGTVIAIDATGVIVQKNGATTRMDLPGT
jgi:hypothetical protein